MDFSGRFINAAMSLQSGQEVEYGEGKVASLSSLQGISPENVTFKQARAVIPNSSVRWTRVDD